ncbi:ABC transporter permease [Cereibacter azotoformans]|uniref:NitT/TauT family transport system permease protein n=1 Tax=Cereibacter azotoformans TaxID=43057 RepID=A0A2T5KBE4_9RHOB|nr:ABC transporter permease [Cereibacter azotoformans]AXQ93838.1 ABC transporter permease [Cereibacter sphaeroides]MBO4168357.1 ABC transporter permease [Cereibacter azotoformans]PTR19672.1 NitT/TauT family transport system permease protein [Cereibacter azotoformans]UIJ29353.1 ABC transporter permease [Cereibacter azotoformans]
MTGPRPQNGPGRRPAGAGTVTLMRLAFLLCLILLWALAAATVPRGMIPSPAATVEAARRLLSEGRLQGALGQSLITYGTGLGAAILVGIPLGALMGMVRLFGRTVDVFVFALAATPRVAFIPLIIVLLGLGIEAKAMIVFLGAVMPIILNTYAGVQARDEELIEMARSTGASATRIQIHVVLPGALPFLVVGLRLGATIGLINTVVAELYTAVSGLGGLLALYGNTFRMAEYFVIVLALAAIGVIVTESLRLLEGRLSRWRLPGRP